MTLGCPMDKHSSYCSRLRTVWDENIFKDFPNSDYGVSVEAKLHFVNWSHINFFAQNWIISTLHLGISNWLVKPSKPLVGSVISTMSFFLCVSTDYSAPLNNIMGTILTNRQDVPSHQIVYNHGECVMGWYFELCIASKITHWLCKHTGLVGPVCHSVFTNFCPFYF